MAGSKRNEFVRSPVRYAVITTMYTEVTSITGKASHRSRTSPLRTLTPTTNTELIPVERTRNAASFERMTFGTPRGRVSLECIASTQYSQLVMGVLNMTTD